MIEFTINHSTEKEIKGHLERVSPLFKPELSSYVNLETYSSKIFEKADRIETWDNKNLVGLIAYYLNEEGSFAFITNVSLEKGYVGRGIASHMMGKLIERVNGTANRIKLEVKPKNKGAINFYTKCGFTIEHNNGDTITMENLL